MTYSIRNIIKIFHDKIIYYDNDNMEQEINLQECSKNYAQYYNQHIQDYITFDGKPASKIAVEDNKCVGCRDWFAKKPYFEFFLEPKIVFEIQPKKRLIDYFNKYWRHRYYSEFHKVSLDLYEVGWTTFDLG